jgi:hypothetical protein
VNPAAGSSAQPAAPSQHPAWRELCRLPALQRRAGLQVQSPALERVPARPRSRALQKQVRAHPPSLLAQVRVQSPARVAQQSPAHWDSARGLVQRYPPAAAEALLLSAAEPLGLRQSLRFPQTSQADKRLRTR